MVYQGTDPSKPFTRGPTSFTNSENLIGVVVKESKIALDIVSYLSVAIVGDRFQPLPRIGVRESPLIFLRMLVFPCMARRWSRQRHCSHGVAARLLPILDADGLVMVHLLDV